MKTLVVPRLDAAALKAYSRAHSAERRRRAAARSVSLVDADRCVAPREGRCPADRTASSASTFWLLHAR